MLIVSRCLHLATMEYSPILTVIQPAELHQQEATFSLAYRSMIDPNHLLHQLMVGPTLAEEKRDYILNILLC